MSKHPWHEVPHRFNSNDFSIDGIIEIPRGSKAKYEVDKPTGLLRLDRVTFSAFVYPINYGFIPQTLGDDGDPLDILILSEVAIEPLCIARARIIGYMQMKDSGKFDEKIIAVAEGDMSVAHINSIELLPENFKSELKHFFQQYKALMKREVIVEEFLGLQDACRIINESIDRYDAHYGTSRK
ncbi:MAG: inorganic diphosphatase [Flavobacteriales bacterium]